MIKLDCKYSTKIDELTDWDDVFDGFSDKPEVTYHEHLHNWVHTLNHVAGHPDRNRNLRANNLKINKETFDVMEMFEYIVIENNLFQHNTGELGHYSVNICEDVEYGKIIVSDNDAAIGEINITEIPNKIK